MMFTDSTIHELLLSARASAAALQALSDEQASALLADVAARLAQPASMQAILDANAADLQQMDPANPRYDRLQLTPERITAIADDVMHVSTLPSPKCMLEERTLPNGLQIKRVAVPFGVIGVIYEARPNVTIDVFSLCFKSGNVCVLKGGHEAAATNLALIQVVHDALRSAGLPTSIATLLPPTRAAAEQLMKARGTVDLIIPRGSRDLIGSVRKESLVPVIETGAGVCHCYVEASADIDMAARIVNNAKTRRVSVCNALDTLIIDRAIAHRLPEICHPLAASEVAIHADDPAYAALQGTYPANLLHHASADNYGHEYLGYAMTAVTVDNCQHAISHINRYGSGHSESVVTGDDAVADMFSNQVDAACVYVNAPTSFTDGAQFGLGAEIGISTQKMHARGPMALRELMTYKWLIRGDGQIRS